MKKLNTVEMRQVEGGWDKCRICGQTVRGNWWTKYYHCLKHASRCLPWASIMGIAFGIWC